MLKITKLTTEYLSDACVTDAAHPRFSFALESDKNNVALRSAVFTVGAWSSETNEQFIIYDGAALSPRKRYCVEVVATDNYGETACSKMYFTTGKMDEKWQADWITDGSFILKGSKQSPPPMTFRKLLLLENQPVSAKLYVTAMGIYEFSINGKKVGDDYFAPGFTSYKHQIQYQVYDVLELLKTENCLLAVVGGGWAVGSLTGARKNKNFVSRQALIAELRIEYYDGHKQVVGTDQSWEVTESGNYKFGDFYDGEIYDATLDAASIKWKKAAIETFSFNPQLIATYGALVKAHEILKPVSFSETPGGEIIFDFGQNFSGVINAEITATHGQKIVFRHAEVLKNGELNMSLLRSAKAMAEYTAVSGVQTYSPKFTYMGFRYVGVSGISAEKIKISAYVLYSDINKNGSFSCSNERINRLQSNIVWSAKSNFVDIPTDCPQRDERMGWTGDIALFAKTACYNFDMSRFLGKWLKDVGSQQRGNGEIPVVIPQPGNAYPVSHVAFWGDAAILVPWAEYLKTGDTRLLSQMYPIMTKYLRGIIARNDVKKRRIWTTGWQYGDWVAPDTEYRGWLKRGKWTATACLKNSCDIVAAIADVVGDNEGNRFFIKLSNEISTAYKQEFFINGKLKTEFQTAYVLSIVFDILEGKDKQNALKRLIQLIEQNEYCIGTGFPGTPYVLFALADNGYEDVAYKMLSCEKCPSWLYEIVSGATTIWERWDALKEDGSIKGEGKKDPMISFNHYASGAVGDFLYRRISGIEPIEGGYKSFRISPTMAGRGITSASGSIVTPYGEIKSKWDLSDSDCRIYVEVPVGTTCKLKFFGLSENLGSGKYEYKVKL